MIQVKQKRGQAEWTGNNSGRGTQTGIRTGRLVRQGDEDHNESDKHTRRLLIRLVVDHSVDTTQVN